MARVSTRTKARGTRTPVAVLHNRYVLDLWSTQRPNICFVRTPASLGGWPAGRIYKAAGEKAQATPSIDTYALTI